MNHLVRCESLQILTCCVEICPCIHWVVTSCLSWRASTPSALFVVDGIYGVYLVIREMHA